MTTDTHDWDSMPVNTASHTTRPPRVRGEVGDKPKPAGVVSREDVAHVRDLMRRYEAEDRAMHDRMETDFARAMYDAAARAYGASADMLDLLLGHDTRPDTDGAS